MPPPAEDLRSAVARFRRARAEIYLTQLSSAEPPGRALEADFAAPCHPERSEAYVELSSELREAEHAALGAHLLRAHMERAVRRGRAGQAGWARLPAELSGQRRPLAAHFSDPASLASESSRAALLRATERALEGVYELQRDSLRRAGQATADALRTLQPGRHADAGPADGVAALAEVFLADSDDLQREALGQLSREQGFPIRHAVDLFAALRCRELAPMPPEGRGQRVGELWRGIGLRDALNTAARLGPVHGAGWPRAQVVVRGLSGGLLILPSAVEAGLASELAMVEASGRVLGLASVSRALPVELRVPAVASVSRALGMTAVWGLTHAPLWQRHYGVGRREARALAQATGALVLCRARLHVAALLARGQGPEELSALAGRALGVSVSGPLAVALLSRLSPGGDGRAALQTPGLAAVLRDQFDEDWLRNPRAAEPWLGACLQGGETSVEALAEELSADRKAGLSLLAELF